MENEWSKKKYSYIHITPISKSTNLQQNSSFPLLIFGPEKTYLNITDHLTSLIAQVIDKGLSIFLSFKLESS